MNRKTIALVVGFVIRAAIFTIPLTLPLAPIWYPLTWLFYIISYRRETDHIPPYQKFSKSTPFFHYGLLVREHNLSFPSVRKDEKAEDLEKRVHGLVETVVRDIPHITSRLTEPKVRSVTIADVGLPTKPYEKTFIEYSTETTLNTRVSVIFGVTAVNDMVSIRWWVLMRGRVDLWKTIQAGLIAPFTVLYWGMKKLQDVYSIKAALGSEIEQDYDLLDVEVWLGSFQTQVFNDLIQRMGKSGFDVETYKKQAINVNQPLFVGENSSLQIGNRAFVEKIEGSQETITQTDALPVLTQVVISQSVEDTVEVPQIYIEPVRETEPDFPPHLRQLQYMLRAHIGNKNSDAQHEAKAVVNELIVELETGDEISIKVFTALLGELRTVLGDMALRDTLETLTDPAGSFNDIIQEITGDMLADLNDELTLKDKKQALNDALVEYANQLDMRKLPQARIAIFSLMRALDNPDTQSYDWLYKDILLRIGREAYEFVLHTIEPQANCFPSIAQLSAKRELAMETKKQDLRNGLMSRIENFSIAKKEKAVQAIEGLVSALENPDTKDYKPLFKEIGLSIGKNAYESALRALATDENYFPNAQAAAKRDLEIYERIQQKTG